MWSLSAAAERSAASFVKSSLAAIIARFHSVAATGTCAIHSGSLVQHRR